MAVKTADDYLQVLQALLPPGQAITRHPRANITRLLRACAVILADVDASIAGLADEADPRTTIQLLPDWERVAGLPDPAVGGAAQSIVERRAWLAMRLTSIGGQSTAYFIGLAAKLGATVTIDEFQAFGCGFSQVGRDQMSGDASVRFQWRVNMPDQLVYLFQMGASQVGDPLGYVRTGVIEALFARFKPSHTTLIFNYGSD